MSADPSSTHDLPENLRGFSNNKFGGHKRIMFKNVKGKFGAANKGRTYTSDELEAYCRKHENTIITMLEEAVRKDGRRKRIH